MKSKWTTGRGRPGACPRATVRVAPTETAWILRGGSLMLAVILVGLAWITPAKAVPVLPASFFGVVSEPSTGSMAPTGITVAALVNGVTIGTTTTFNYGGSTVYRLDVNGDDPDTPQKDGALEGEMIIIRVDSRLDRNAIWRGGASTRLELNWTAPVLIPPPVGGGGGAVIFGGGSTLPGVAPPPVAAAASSLQVNIIGTSASINIDAAGRVQQDAKVTVGTAGMALSIPRGTRLSKSDGSPVTSITVRPVSTNIPPVPTGLAVIGQVLDFGPEGTKLDPPAKMTIDYLPAQLPPGTVEEKLFAAFWNGKDWAPLKSAVDTKAKTVTYEISHFSLYALMATIVIPGPTPTPLPPQTVVQPKPTTPPPPQTVVQPKPTELPVRRPETVVQPKPTEPPTPPAIEAPVIEERKETVAPPAPAPAPPQGPAPTKWPLIGIVAALAAAAAVFAWRTWFYVGRNPE